jgi:hypothetical protein
MINPMPEGSQPEGVAGAFGPKFSVPLGLLCLGGSAWLTFIHHRGTEDTEVSQRQVNHPNLTSLAIFQQSKSTRLRQSVHHS